MFSPQFVDEFDLEQALIHRERARDFKDFPDIEIPAEIQKASAKRIGHFRSGRQAAAMALKKLGAMELVSRSSQGVPIWPAGFTGSISHTAQIAWSVVGSTKIVAGIGIDCERRMDSKAADEIREVVGNEDEFDLLQSNVASDIATTILFSAKEAIYKCLNPLTGWAMNFSDVVVESFESNTLQARIHAERFGDSAPMEVAVECQHLFDHVFSICVLQNLNRNRVNFKCPGSNASREAIVQ